MYLPGKIMRSGGGDPARATTWLFDSATMQWTVAPQHMSHARRNLNLVILPDGKVLAVGGNTSGWRGGPVWAPEIWNPSTGTWSELASAEVGDDFVRGYHSTAMLLPDGRVLSAGGEGSRTGQIFSPPYIRPAWPRSTIISAPQTMAYGRPYELAYLMNGGMIATQAVLIRLSSTTHGFDMDQRYIPLKPSGIGPGSLTVRAPSDANHAPPGWYMLFILAPDPENFVEMVPCDIAAYVLLGA